MQTDYIQISKDNSTWYNIPVPKRGSGSVEIVTMVDAARNASGEMIGQPVGSDKIKLNLDFPPLPDAEFYGLLKLFDRSQGGKFVVWVKFYDPRVRRKVVKRMYVGDRKGTPLFVGDTSTGRPQYWTDVTVNLIEV